MAKHPILSIVIADGGRARFVTPAENHALHTGETLESATVHQPTSALVSDRPGRSFESASPTRHAITARHDPHEMEKQKFAHEVGGRICAAAAAGQFDELVLVAPAPILAELEAKLDTPTRARLIGRLAKDLVGVPDHELQPHLASWVPPPHRA